MSDTTGLIYLYTLLIIIYHSNIKLELNQRLIEYYRVPQAKEYRHYSIYIVIYMAVPLKKVLSLIESVTQRSMIDNNMNLRPTYYYGSENWLFKWMCTRSAMMIMIGHLTLTI